MDRQISWVATCCISSFLRPANKDGRGRHKADDKRCSHDELVQRTALWFHAYGSIPIHFFAFSCGA